MLRDRLNNVAFCHNTSRDFRDGLRVSIKVRVMFRAMSTPSLKDRVEVRVRARVR